MNFGWETQEEKLMRYMKISAKKKLEWLWKMHEFTLAAATKKRRAIFWKLREVR